MIEKLTVGKVYLVGAGPGDPGLITVKGMECLKQAEVVVYDRLIDDRMLEGVNEAAEKIYNVIKNYQVTKTSHDT